MTERRTGNGIGGLRAVDLAQVVRQGAHFYMEHQYHENDAPAVGIGEDGFVYSTASHVAEGCKGCAAEAALAELVRRCVRHA